MKIYICFYVSQIREKSQSNIDILKLCEKLQSNIDIPKLCEKSQSNIVILKLCEKSHKVKLRDIHLRGYP